MNVKDNLMESLSELTNKDNKDNTNIFFIKEDTETNENAENTPINVINTPVTTNIPPDINNSIEQRSNYRSSYLSPSTPTATIRPSYTPTSLPRTPLPRTPIPSDTLSRSSLYTEPLHTEPLSRSIISRRYTSSNNQYNRQPLFTSISNINAPYYIPIRSNIGASKEDSEDTKEEKFEEYKGESETIAGFILEISGKFPKIGEKINFNRYTFTIEALDRKRIKQLKVTRNHE